MEKHEETKEIEKGYQEENNQIESGYQLRMVGMVSNNGELNQKLS